MGVRSGFGRFPLVALLIACGSSSACSTDTSGTGDCDPSSEDCPSPDRDSSIGGDSSALDARIDSTPIDSTVVDSADSTIADTTDVGLDTVDATDTTPADTSTSDTTTADTTPSDTATTDTADAASEDSGLASDPSTVRCRAATNCLLAEGDVCCTPMPDGGTPSPWRCWDSSTCVAGTGMACDETADCSGTDKCCASSTSATTSSCQPTCSGIQLCMTDAECGSGKSCAPFTHVSGAILGSCTP